MIEWTKKKGGWTRVVNGLRENYTDEEYQILGDMFPEPAEELAVEPKAMTRREIQAKAKALGIAANQSTETLLEMITEAENE